MRICILRAALGVALALASPGRAGASEADCDALRGDEQILPGQLVGDGPAGWRSLALPASRDLDAALARLDYADELPFVYPVDLDGDGEVEYVLSSPGGRLCGNAGCPYVLLAGRPLAQIGELFGHLAILDERVQGHRIVQSYSRYLGDVTSLDTFVFDGGVYRRVSHALVERCGLEQWSRRMRRAE